jgi:hypothetical protein
MTFTFVGGRVVVVVEAAGVVVVSAEAGADARVASGRTTAAPKAASRNPLVDRNSMNVAPFLFSSNSLADIEILADGSTRS